LNRLDLVLILLLFGVGIYLVETVFITFHYQWNWAVIPQYFFRFDTLTDSWVPNLLVTGFLTTIRLTIWSSLMAILLGTVAAVVIRSGGLYFRLLARSYVELVRNTPPLVLVFIFYFFFGNQLMAMLKIEDFLASRSENTRYVLSILFATEERFPEFLSAVLTLALFEGAYMTEIIRAGLEAVPRGQWEAADALGLTVWSKYQDVILPQSFRIMLPALAGQIISTIKDSAIVSVISIQELTFQGMELMSATYLTFETWITITVMYFCLTYSCSLGAGCLERYFQKER